MRWPDKATPRPGGARGAEVVQLRDNAAEYSSANESPIPDLVAAHFCSCRGGAVCVFCLAWNRRIRNVEARRAEALRRQELGDLCGVAV